MNETQVFTVERYFGFPTALGFILLFLAAAITIGTVAAIRYSERAIEVAAYEGRFITTEWELLTQLKVETDLLLLEKDSEILLMRNRLAQLMTGNGTPNQRLDNPEINDLMVSLERAYVERDAIVKRRFAISAGTTEDEELERSASNTELLPPDSELSATGDDLRPAAVIQQAAVVTGSAEAFALSEAEIRFRQAYRLAVNRLSHGEIDLAEEALLDLGRALERINAPNQQTFSVSMMRQVALLEFLYDQLQTSQRLEAEIRRQSAELVAARELVADAERNALRIASLNSSEQDELSASDVEAAVERAREETRVESRREMLVELDARLAAERDQIERTGRQTAYEEFQALVTALLSPEESDAEALENRARADEVYERLVYLAQELAVQEIPASNLLFPEPTLIAIVVRADADLIRAELTTTNAPSSGAQVLIAPNGSDWDGALGVATIEQVSGTRVFMRPETSFPVAIRDLVYLRPIQDALR